MISCSHWGMFPAIYEFNWEHNNWVGYYEAVFS